MTINLLTQRLKAFKAELTNLKTAHERGLGNMKVYTTTLPITYTSGSHLLNLTVDFETSGVAYPFVQVYGAMNPSGDHDYNLRVLGGGYTNNGYTYKMMGVYHVEQGLDSIFIQSTLPPSSVNYKWGR